MLRVRRRTREARRGEKKVPLFAGKFRRCKPVTADDQRRGQTQRPCHGSSQPKGPIGPVNAPAKVGLHRGPTRPRCWPNTAPERWGAGGWAAFGLGQSTPVLPRPIASFHAGINHPNGINRPAYYTRFAVDTERLHSHRNSRFIGLFFDSYRPGSIDCVSWKFGLNRPFLKIISSEISDHISFEIRPFRPTFEI